MIRLCSSECGGCRCHLSAPCPHCVKHFIGKLWIYKKETPDLYAIECDCSVTLIYGFSNAQHVAGDHLEWHREQVGT
jgi:hypothetical protein